MELDYLMEQKLQLLIQMNNKKFEKELQDIKEQLAQTVEELQQVKRTVNSVPPKQEVQETLAPPQEAKQDTSPQREVASESKELTPEDVSVEKMFYFGKR